MQIIFFKGVFMWQNIEKAESMKKLGKKLVL